MSSLNYCLMISENGEWALARSHIGVSMPLRKYEPSIGVYTWVVADFAFVNKFKNDRLMKMGLNNSIIPKILEENLEASAILAWIDFSRTKYLG